MPTQATIALQAKERTAGAIDLDMLISIVSLRFSVDLPTGAVIGARHAPVCLLVVLLKKTCRQRTAGKSPGSFS
jgi:hypothetical protein